ncbi:unnamed protein product, partial [Polarella glacialis]
FKATTRLPLRKTKPELHMADDHNDLRAALRGELFLVAKESQETLRGILRAELQGLLQELKLNQEEQSCQGQKPTAGVVADPPLSQGDSAGPPLPRRATDIPGTRLHLAKASSSGSVHDGLSKPEAVQPEPWRRHPRKAQGQKSPKRKSCVPEVTEPQQMPLLAKENLNPSLGQDSDMSTHLPKLRFPSMNGASWVAQLVESAVFSSFIAAIILLNALTIGAQTDYMARYQTNNSPSCFYFFEAVFCFIFTTELSLRIYVHRGSFFFGPERRWNLFDGMLVSMQLLEQLMEFLVFMHAGLSNSQLSEYTDDTGTLRVLRIFRILRILRLLRTVHLNGELQAIMVAITTGMRSFFWTVALTLLLTYVVGIFLTQCVTDHQITQTPESLNHDLEDFYGTLGSTMLSLFQAISGGEEWRKMLSPMMSDITVWLSVPFCMYIAFVAFAMMNILTGIFVDKSMQSGQEEKRRMLLQEIQAVFDNRHSSEITWLDFQAQLQNPHLQQLFAALDVDEKDAHDLFHVLDTSQRGAIEVEDFVNGCLRLDGAAKAVDLAAFTEEHRRTSRYLMEQADFMNKGVQSIAVSIRPAPFDSKGFD